MRNSNIRNDQVKRFRLLPEVLQGLLTPGEDSYLVSNEIQDTFIYVSNYLLVIDQQ